MPARIRFANSMIKLTVRAVETRMTRTGVASERSIIVGTVAMLARIECVAWRGGHAAVKTNLLVIQAWK